MKLAQFINDHMDAVLLEWDRYAKTLFVSGTSNLILRDHARAILQNIAVDIETEQTAGEQIEKSEGQPAGEIDRQSAASVHGTLRHSNGFTLIQLTSEYRALRATVIRQWMPNVKNVDDQVLDDLTRFNEAIDQALAESVITFSESADRTRDTFLAILGHDLRSPLSTISMAGRYFSRIAGGSLGTQQMGARIARSAANMSAMVNDLLEYARTQLGGGIPLTRRKMDLLPVCEAAMEDAQAGHPDCPFDLEATGDLSGAFDGPRLQQVFSNLLNNAAQYRSALHPVRMVVSGQVDTVTVQVFNRGPVIPAKSLQAIFDPLVQLSADDEDRKGAPASSLGLGLFIAREITAAHDGNVTAESNEQDGTVFTVQLPRKSAVVEAM
jgi:signal transduction histidine kinase